VGVVQGSRGVGVVRLIRRTLDLARERGAGAYNREDGYTERSREN
jgi:hypothetical protein